MIEYRALSDQTIVVPSGTEAIRFVGCEDLKVEGVDQSAINYGNMVAVDSCKRLKFYDPVCRDGYLTATNVGAQVTAFGIDGTPEGGVYSEDISFIRPRATNLLASAASQAALGGHQTDGFNIASQYTRGVQILDPYISDVGEGVDNFGRYTRVRGGQIFRARQYPLKWIHGGSSGRVDDVEICWFGIHGVSVWGSNSATWDAARNVFRGVDARQANYEGKYTANDFSAFATLIPAGWTTKPTLNIFDGCLTDGTAKWDVLTNCPVGAGNQFRRTVNLRNPSNVYNSEGAAVS